MNHICLFSTQNLPLINSLSYSESQVPAVPCAALSVWSPLDLIGEMVSPAFTCCNQLCLLLLFNPSKFILSLGRLLVNFPLSRMPSFQMDHVLVPHLVSDDFQRSQH